MSRPDEGLIHQWLDGECTPEESAQIERLVATDAEWAAAVAEARGLIAASSRIVGALDAVPHALPKQAASAKGGGASAPHVARTFGVPRWMGIAAGLVLVAGTAYVLREQSRVPFGPAATAVVDAAPSAPVTDTAPGTQVTTDPRLIVPPTDVPPTGPARNAAQGAASGGTMITTGVSTSPQVEPASAAAPPPPPVAAELPAARQIEDAAKRRAEGLAAEQEASRARVSRAVARPMATASAPTSAPTSDAAPTVPVLDGCWRVTAPPELLGVLINPPIRRAAGDTLVLLTLRGEVSVTRSGDRLRGGLEAVQEPCRAP